jgi:MPBQ/MSBQ methyltransferase
MNQINYDRTHPHFISIEAYDELLQNTSVMENIKTADWCEPTIASWRHSIWVGIYDPRGWIFKPKTYFKCFRDAYCLERMHRAFKRGLMEYGMFAATKQLVPVKNMETAVELKQKTE